MVTQTLGSLEKVIVIIQEGMTEGLLVISSASSDFLYVSLKTARHIVVNDTSYASMVDSHSKRDVGHDTVDLGVHINDVH